MIHLTNEEYDNILAQIDREKKRADEAEKYSGLLNANERNLVVELQQALSESNKRAGVAEAVVASIKSHLDDLWMEGNASEHEYAFNTLKLIEKLERGDTQ